MYQKTQGSHRRVGLVIDLDMLYKNHTGVFAGIQQYADDAGWNTILDEWVEGSLARATPPAPWSRRPRSSPRTPWCVRRSRAWSPVVMSSPAKPSRQASP